MGTLKYFVSVPDWVHEYLLGLEKLNWYDPIVYRAILTEVSRRQGRDIRGQNGVSLIGKRLRVWIEFCLEPLKLGERNCPFNVQSGRFEMNNETRKQFFRKITMERFSALLSGSH